MNTPVVEGDAVRYDTEVNLDNPNNSHTQLVLMTGPDRRVLEVGPATGYLTKILRDRGCRVTGIELDPVAASRAEQYAERMIVGNIEELAVASTFGDDRFDVILLGDVLEHLLDPGGTLLRLGSLLAPGGEIIASIPNVSHASVRLALLAGAFRYTEEGLLDRSHVRFFTREGVQALFAGAGFVIEEWRRTTLGPFDTEVELQNEDFPPVLVDAVRALPESLTYQFIVRARPVETHEVPRPGAGVEDARRAVASFWSVEERLDEHLKAVPILEGALEERDRALVKRNRETAELQRQIRHRDYQLEEAAHRFVEEQRALQDLSEELAQVRGAAGYRLASAVSRRLRRWFPAGTWRGRFLGWLRRRAYRALDRRSRHAEGEPANEDLPVEPFIPLEDYQQWMKEREPSTRTLEAQREEARALPYRPLVSVVVPTWNPDPALLRETVDAVRTQTYDRWELCVADGGSGEEARAVLRELADQDQRIQVAMLDENLGISGNTNAALKLGKGEFVAFLDQSDILAPAALFEIAVALNRDPGLDVMYSDFDLLSSGGVRLNPFFTPEWSPELLLSTNYMTHLSVVRRRLLEEVGGLREDLDGAQDWDLLLRVTERTDRVRRIPAVLYHWRVDASSAAVTLHAKPDAEEAQRRAVQEHLGRTGVAATVHREPGGTLRIRPRLAEEPLVSIIIPTRHNRPMLERCLEGIQRSTYPNREVLIIETAGQESDRENWYRAMGQRYPMRVLWWNKPFNYSAVNNLGAREATGDVLVFLNDDAHPEAPTWLDDLVGWLQRDGVGAVAPQLLDDDGEIQHGGVIVGMAGFAEHLFRGLRPGAWSLMGSTLWYRNVSAVSGACLAMTRRTLDSIGGWDEHFVLCGSDVELGLRLRRHGYRLVVDPYAVVRHTERATRGDNVPDEDFCTSLWHYQALLYGGDPYFNPNLSPDNPIPTLARTDDQTAAAVVSRVIGRDLVPRVPGDESAHTDALLRACHVTKGDLDTIRDRHQTVRGHRDVRTINWFIPDFENPFYGGIHTIFRFADHLHRKHGVQNRFVVIGTGPPEFIRSGLRVTFPAIETSEILLVPGGDDAALRKVPEADAAIATLWLTAYPMARWRGADRLFYFVQDFEPMFYPAGAVYALAEETYRMPLYGIANTRSLQEAYESYGGTAVAFTPAVDGDLFHADRPPREPDDPATVFMYARPGHPRNCYELAIAALGKVKGSMGDRLRVVTAGSWTPGATTEAWVDHLGLLSYAETADLYRRCDAGLVLSVSKHPTYIPLQLMACGSLVVANDNPANGWLLRDGENSILADPTVDALAESLERGLTEPVLRKRLTQQALDDIGARHSDWVPEIERVFEFLCNPTG